MVAEKRGGGRLDDTKRRDRHRISSLNAKYFWCKYVRFRIKFLRIGIYYFGHHRKNKFKKKFYILLFI